MNQFHPKTFYLKRQSPYPFAHCFLVQVVKFFICLAILKVLVHNITLRPKLQRKFQKSHLKQILRNFLHWASTIVIIFYGSIKIYIPVCLLSKKIWFNNLQFAYIWNLLPRPRVHFCNCFSTQVVDWFTVWFLENRGTPKYLKVREPFCI